MEISEKVCLALLKKGFEYEVDEMKMEMKVPLGMLLGDGDNPDTVMTMKCEFSGFKMKITQD